MLLSLDDARRDQTVPLRFRARLYQHDAALYNSRQYPYFTSLGSTHTEQNSTPPCHYVTNVTSPCHHGSRRVCAIPTPRLTRPYISVPNKTFVVQIITILHLHIMPRDLTIPRPYNPRLTLPTRRVDALRYTMTRPYLAAQYQNKTPRWFTLLHQDNTLPCHATARRDDSAHHPAVTIRSNTAPHPDTARLDYTITSHLDTTGHITMPLRNRTQLYPYVTYRNNTAPYHYAIEHCSATTLRDHAIPYHYVTDQLVS